MTMNRLLPTALLVTATALIGACQPSLSGLLPSTLPGAQVMPGAQSVQGTTRSVIGRVYDDNDMPVHGNTVTARMDDPSQHFANGQPVYVAKIDQGDFGLANLTPPCSFTVTVDLPGYQPETLPFTLTAGGPPVVRGPVFHLKKAPR
jgi:hypothetical protein